MTNRVQLALCTLLLGCLGVLAPTLTSADTHQTVPSANFSFIPDLQNFLRVEDANRYADLHSSVVVAGGLHSTAAGLTGTPSPLTAYLGGFYTTESNSITYPDASTCHVLAHKDITANYGSYTRVAGTHYLLNCASTVPPAIPNSDSVLLMTVTTSGGAITAVTDLRPLGPTTGFDACRYATLTAALTAYGSGPGTFTIACALPATANAILDATTTLRFEQAGYLYCNTNGVTLTINGPIDAPLRRIFSLTNGCTVTPSANATFVLYPQWWGILGDGITNNTTALQLILTALPTGSVLHFPCGDYRILTALTIPDTNRLRFTGNGACSILQNDTANSGVFTVTAGADQLEIDHLKLVSTGSLLTLGRGLIYLNAAGTGTPIKSASFHHLWLAGGSTSGIAGNCLTDSSISTNFFYNDGNAYGEHGLYLSNAGCPSVRNNITDNYFWNTASGNAAGITLRQTKDSNITGNTIVGWKYNILPLSDVGGPVDNVRITDNQLIGAATDGVNFFADGGADPPTRIALDSNTITGAGRNGIRSDFVSNCSISDNQIFGNAESGIRMNSMTNCHLATNKIFDNDNNTNGVDGDDSSGIRLNTSNANNTFTNNVVNVTNVANYQKYGISIGSSGNTGNYFINNVWADNRTAERDVGATTNFWLQVDTNGSWSTGKVDNALIGLPDDRGTCTFSAATSKVCSLTTTQPDNVYYVVTTCNANKTFWVNTKTTTTFTLNASSSSSDNCDWILLR